MYGLKFHAISGTIIIPRSKNKQKYISMKYYTKHTTKFSVNPYYRLFFNF